MSKTESLRSPTENLEGKRVLVAGFARSGRAAADFLHGRGAVVTVSDSRPPWSFAGDIPDLLGRKIGLEFGQHGSDTFARQDLVVVSPGIPWDLPALQAARERGIPVVAEVEAASWFLKGSLVGVTGSNGKTTTTALVGRMLQESGFPASVAGNIGVPLISKVDESTEETVSVVELSSFQLEGAQSMNPHVAVMLNITPNHLDRHPSLEAYIEAKARILRNQGQDDYAVLNADDPVVAGLADRGNGRKFFFSRTQDIPEGLLVSEGQVVYRVGHLQRDLFSPDDVKLRGAFNLENVLAASAAACVLGAGFDAIAKAVREFRGVEHRLEYAGDVLGVAFYNDSKATSVDATVKALGAFDHGVHLILGGKDKGAPYAPLVPLLTQRVREVLLVGAAADRIGKELAGAADLVQAGDLETAVRTAFSRARTGDTVLLSPACSSFDQFEDFEDRGRKFKQIVERLAQEGQVARLRRTWLPPEDQPVRTAPEPAITRSPVRMETATEPFRLSPPAPAPVRTEPDATPEPPVRVTTASPQLNLDVAAQQSAAPEDFSAPVAPQSAAASDEQASNAKAGVHEEEKQQIVPRPEPKVPAIVFAEDTPPEKIGEDLIPAAEPPLVQFVREQPAKGERADRSSGASAQVKQQKAAPEPVEKTIPERVYVYELEAEERPPLYTGDAFSIDEIVLDRGAGPNNLDLDLGPQAPKRNATSPTDEPLFFEVTERTTQGPQTPQPGSAPARPSAAPSDESVRREGKRKTNKSKEQEQFRKD